MNKVRTFGKRTLAVLSACMIPLTGMFSSAPVVNAADNYIDSNTTQTSLNSHKNSNKGKATLPDRSIAKEIDSIVPMSDGTKPDTDYIKGRTLDYTYTGNIYTANSSLYNYISDSGKNALAEGYADPYVNLNKAIESTMNYRALYSSASENLTIRFKGKESSDKNVKVYLFDSSKHDNTWDGAAMNYDSSRDEYVYTVKYDDIGFSPTGLIISGRNERDVLWQTGDISKNLEKGKAYRYYDGFLNDSGSAEDLYKTSVPLYFGCFYREYEENAGAYIDKGLSRYGDSFNQDISYNYGADNKGDKTYDGKNTSRSSDLYKNFYWQANMSFRGNYDGAVQGLVDNTLTDGTITQNGIKMPYFDKEWADSHTSLVKYWENVKFPFYEVSIDANKVHGDDDATGKAIYYQFNSRKDNLYFDQSKGKYKETDTQIKSQGTLIRDENGKEIATDVRTVSYLPFNSSDSENGVNNDLGFGTYFDIKFKIRSDGKVDTVNGNGSVNATFEFMGDDDVWVFIDDKLVLDLGGDHKDTTGLIDFAEKKAYANDATKLGYNSNTGVYVGMDNLSKNLTKQLTVNLQDVMADGTFNSDGSYNESMTHTLRMFYMERGMYESDLLVRFNFAAIPNNNTLKIKEITQFKDINAGLLELTQKAADYDVFDYSISNSGTSADDVGESGILSPTYNYYQRDNLGQKALLSGKDIEYDLVYDNDSIYLDTSKVLSGGHTWDYDTVLAAWIWKDGDDSSSRLYLAQQVDEHLYKFSGFSSDANKVVFCRLHADQSYTDGSSSWPGDGNVYDKAELGFENSYIYVVNDWKNNISKGSRATKQEVHYETHDFDPTQGNAVKNVNYIWTDDTAKIIKNTDTNDLVGTTDGSGSFRLMYGTNENESSAEFQRQFKKGSQMTVNQNDLMKTVERTDVENTPETFGTTKSRSASKYYDTTVTVVDNEGGIIIPETATSKTSYEYSNNNPDSKNPVQITETFVNTPKVGAITVTKNLDPNDNVTDEFEFTIRLYDIFGVSGIEVEDYSLISANKTIGSDGTFILTRDETLVIQGIPYGTKYTVTENPVKNYNLKETSAEGEKIVYEGTFDDESGINIDDANKETVINTRKTNSLTLSKALAGDYSDTDVDEDTPFEFTVNFTAPEGVTLSDYKFKVDGREITGTSSITINVSAKQSVTISGIPYGTGYTVSEALSMVNWSNSGDETGTIGETPSTAVITNTYTKPAVGNLEITKNVLTSTGSDEIEDSDKALVFEFTVTLTDISGAALTTDDTYNMTKTSSAGVSDDMLTFEKGVATVTLSDDESVLIEGIPAGYHYTVTESYMAGFTPSSTNAESAIVKDTTVTAEFTNTKIFQPYELPDAGFEDSRMYFVFMLSGMFMFGIAYWYINRSKAKR